MREIYDSGKGNDGFWSKVSICENSPDEITQLSHVFFPNETLGKFQLSMTFKYEGIGDVIVFAEPYYIFIGNSGQTCICMVYVGNTIAQSMDLKLKCNSINTLELEYSGDSMLVQLNGSTLVFKSQYCSFVSSLEICLPAKSEICDLKVYGDSKPLKLQPSEKMHFNTTIDFYDDMLPEPFTEEMLNEAFEKISEMGVKRVYWVHHGGQNSGFWQTLGDDAICDNVNKTFANLGGDPLSKASEIAHKYGLEIYAVIKPFDMNPMARTFPEGSEEAKKYGRSSIIGGRAYMCFDYVAQHPELCIQRRTKPDLENKAIPSQIELNFTTKDVPQMDVCLWVSENNGTYSVYDQKITVNRMPGRLVIGGINTTAKYLALELLTEANISYGNILKDLVNVYDELGEQIECTLGLKPRKILTINKETFHLDVALGWPNVFVQKKSFAAVGFDFDALRGGVPSGVRCGEAASNYYHELGSKNNVIGIAMGCNDFVPGAMCPSEPKARAYWLSLIQEAIDCGVDGIDIRESSHLDILKWGEYGFNSQIVQEYQKRYGVNILEQEYDKTLLRKLRGEFYTEFLETVGDLVKDSGKKFQLHISDIMMGSPDSSTPMEIHWDWQKWVQCLKPDGITFKAINENSYRSNYALDVVEKCRAQKIPVDYNVFTHCVGDYKKFVEDIRLAGFSSINLYEFASYYKARNGKIEPVDNKLMNEVKSCLK